MVFVVYCACAYLEFVLLDDDHRMGVFDNLLSRMYHQRLYFGFHFSFQRAMKVYDVQVHRILWSVYVRLRTNRNFPCWFLMSAAVRFLGCFAAVAATTATTTTAHTRSVWYNVIVCSYTVR